jgi:protein-S-isoprenylcysteine O-methyltransferase Ste14
MIAYDVSVGRPNDVVEVAMTAPRIAVLAYRAGAYVMGLIVFGYTIGFLADAVVPKGVTDGMTGPVWLALVVDVALLSLFAVQHSVMARPWFKRRWTRVVAPSVERSTYMLATNLVLALAMWQWRPVHLEAWPDQVWSVQNGVARAVLWTVYGVGWAVVLLATVQIGHFDMFGVKQVLARARERAYVEPGFSEPWLYRLVRHPLMVGFLIAFWAAPDMSVGRLVYAGTASAYILVGVRFEERDLRRQLGGAYERYLTEVPGFVPRPRVRVTVQAERSA